MKLMQIQNDFSTEPPWKEFHINSCGYFCDLDFNTNTNRQNGRPDFQLIYVTNGFLAADFGRGERLLPPGSLVVYKPGQPQVYHCRRQDHSSYYWIHFGGSRAGALLQSCGLYEKNCYSSSLSDSDISVVCTMMTEVTHKPQNYQMKVLGLFVGLLADLSRRTSSESQGRNHYARLMPALLAMERETHMTCSVADYAAMCRMSPSHFLHLFRTFAGQSPMQYRNHLAMERARGLLTATDLPVGEIAQAVGVQDPLYFSKKFKRHFGISPTDFRKKNTDQ